ncbi:UDP-2,3-diacylglucosamine diphosphatase [Thiomicrorhabdus arctica]|uniref:UDP-2,3-diacylglucosamine diphosphatase n=1 Tax=Thiomicrorhabdus arctica TaxID=131540 RepID=UPI0003695CD1|nr:UDP-2,3-diacylglucosamine diphosphatase [Thiomicrorhabdus arctica]
MNPYTLFVADIHLQPEPNHPINQAFENFLIEEAPKAQALYILGDLFEMWVGDDIGLEQYAPIISTLKLLTDNGLLIYAQYGNRDFLMREDFWHATGIQFLAEPTQVTLYQHTYLIMHGDNLCTDDKGYQRMRSILRNSLVQWLFLNLGRKRRLAIGQKMRCGSAQHSQNKSQAIMDVNSQAVCDLFKQYPHIEHIIHGHTHRPQHHLIEVDHITLHRWVLGDWQAVIDGPSTLLRVSASGPELIDYPY